jgi:hypothetical protein
MLPPPPIHVSVLRLRHRSTTHRYTLHFFFLLRPSRSTRVLYPILSLFAYTTFYRFARLVNFSSRPSSLEPPKRRRGCAILHPLILITTSRTIVEAQRRTREDVHLHRKILTRVSSCNSSKHPPEPLQSTVIRHTRRRHQPAICWLSLQTDYPGSTPIRL